MQESLEDSVTQVDLLASDGVRLIGDRRGVPEAAAVLFMHGGGQTRHSWAGTAALLAAVGWQTVTMDARGHGDSGWSASGDYFLPRFARDAFEILGTLPPKPVLVGASLGGLTALILAGELAPGSVRAVILVDIVPEVEPAGAERIRAFMLEHSETGFGSLTEVADAIAAYNPHRPRPADLSGLAKNVRRRGDRWYWHWDPMVLGGEAEVPPPAQMDLERLNSAVQRIVDADTPMLLVRGMGSDVVTPGKAADFLRRFPTVESAEVSGAGHMVSGDRNDIFNEALIGFLRRHEPTR
jgi:pimeloyl-ACP methyl ester carboxylesterase